MIITQIYASLLALLFVALSFRVIAVRRGAGIPLGDGSNQQLLRRQRVHANFAEYVPLALILMALAEQQGAAAWVVHGIGCLLVAGRVLHAFGVSRAPEVFAFRVTGMVLTFAAIIISALTGLLQSAHFVS
jgi:uncharacterized protein